MSNNYTNVLLLYLLVIPIIKSEPCCKSRRFYRVKTETINHRMCCYQVFFMMWIQENKCPETLTRISRGELFDCHVHFVQQETCRCSTPSILKNVFLWQKPHWLFRIADVFAPRVVSVTVQFVPAV